MGFEHWSGHNARAFARLLRVRRCVVFRSNIGPPYSIRTIIVIKEYGVKPSIGCSEAG